MVIVSILTLGHWLVNLKNLAQSIRLHEWSYVQVEFTVYAAQSILDAISEKLHQPSVDVITKAILVSHSGSFHIHSALVAQDIIRFPVVGTHRVTVLL